jgi:hypothetical protein
VREPYRLSWAKAALLGVCALACSGCTSAPNDPAPDGGAGDAARRDVSTLGGDAGDGAVEAGSDADSGGCHPMNVSGFQPPPYPSPPARSLACSGQNGDGGLVALYGEACLGHAATYGSCAAFGAPDAASAAACVGCLLTPENWDASLNAVVVSAPIPVVNYAVCIQDVDPTDAGISCARALYAAGACVEYACESTCPVTDDVSRAAFEVCTNEAWSGPCAGYALLADSCVGAENDDGGTPVATVCFAGTSKQDHYLAIAHYVCGGS